MISNIASSGVHAAEIAALRQNRAKKTESARDTSVATGETPSARPAHPHGHVPPGLARAAEKIASKIFARSDADASGTVTLQELNAVHSKHARTLASSALFQATGPETAISETAATTEIPSDSSTDASTETETSASISVTETQLKEALTQFFYSKVGITYAPPAPATPEPPNTAVPPETSTPSVLDPTSNEPASAGGFTAVA